MTHRFPRLPIAAVALVACLGSAAPPASATATSASTGCAAPALAVHPAQTGRSAAGRPTVGLASSIADTTDDGRGTFRLCLEGEGTRSGRAICRWNEARTTVTSVQTLRLRLDGRAAEVSAWTQTSLWDGSAEIATRVDVGRPSWSTEAPGWEVVERPATDELRIRFHAVREEDPTSAPRVGTVAYRCGGPPPLDGRDLTVGQMSFRIGDEPDMTWETPVICHWAMWANETRVDRVASDSMPVRVGPGRYRTVDLAMDRGRSIEARVRTYHWIVDEGDAFVDDDHAYPVWTGEDRARGTVRSHALLPEMPDGADGEPGGMPPGTLTIDLLATWDCGDPPKHRLPTHHEWPARVGRPGLVRIHLPGMSAGDIIAAASCAAGEDSDGGDPGGPSTDFSSGAAAFELNGRPALLVADDTGFAALYLADQDGRYAGDLVHPGDEDTDRNGDDHGVIDMPAMILQRSSLTTDPTIPATVSIEMVWDCGPGLGALR